MEHFFCKTKIIFGANAISELKALHIQRLFLVCDPFFAQNGTAQKLIVAANAKESQVFSQVVPDPSVHLAAEGAAKLQSFQPDTVVALGGGSAMDSAKAMTFFSGLHPTFIAVPTTSGSGSEVTDFAILTHDGVKHPLVDESLKPDIAILDTDLVSSLPPALIADGGFDLISHVLEAYVATNAGILSDTMASKGFEIALQELAASYNGNLDSRGKMHTAATMAGIAFSQAGLGICHAISHSLGGAFHIPHGRLNAILLPAVLDANAEVCLAKYACLARQAGISTGNDVLSFRALKNALLRLRRNLKLPETLAQAGVAPVKVQQQLDSLVEAALQDGCCSTNPKTADAATVKKIITEVMGRG